MKMAAAIAAVLLFNPAMALADWDGYDVANHADVSIEDEDSVEEGQIIEIYSNGQYKDVEVKSIEKQSDNTTILKVFDVDGDETSTFIMEEDNAD